MIKSIKAILAQDKEKFKVPRKVQDLIPIKNIWPDGIERAVDHIKLGEKYARVLFLKDYASYIKDSMFSELTELNRNLMLSIDVIPIPTDEAVREVERLLLGVETNITGWQRRQNQNNNFSAVVPYDIHADG